MAFERQIIFYKRYFLDFYEELPDNVRVKIEWTLGLIRVTLHIKKTQKTPKKEIEKALRIMEEYKNEKDK